MKISALNSYHSIQIRKQSNKLNTNTTKLSTPAFKNWYSNYDVEKYRESFTTSLKERKAEIFNHLDGLTTTTENGKTGTITDILKSYFGEEKEQKKINGLMHKTQRENVEPITSNGFDFSKVNTTEYGPGMYFSGSETELLIYSGETIGIDYEGTTAVAKNIKEYNSLKSSLINEVRKYLNLGFSNIENVMAEAEVISNTIINEYCREKIVNDLGIDGAFIPYGNSYFEVFNPNAIKNVYKK